MLIEVAAKGYLVDIEVREFTQKTIRSYRNNLNLFLRYCKEETKECFAEYVAASWNIFEYVGA